MPGQLLPEKNTLASTRQAIITGVLTIGLLLAYGLFRYPAVLTSSPTGIRSLVGDVCILVIYGLAGWAGPAFVTRADPRILRSGNLAGLLAGAIFTAEILLEYWLLPRDNSSFGLVEYSLAFVVFFLVSAQVAWRAKAWRKGWLAAILSALISSLIWYGVVLFIFYLFSGTPQQTQVFRAEGNYADFARSGLNDFNTFVMEDFMGAGFFHSLLLPAAAAIVGALGALAGKALSRLRKA